jgi:Glycosyl transferase family 2
MTTQLVRVRDSQLSLISTPPTSQCEVCVIIPVKDEAQTLEKTLEAFLNQTLLSGEPLSPLCYEVIVLANNCTDNSAAIARQFAISHPNLALHVAEVSLPPEQAYVGYARKLLMDEAYRRLMSLGHYQGIIASTDGDSEVAGTWIAATLHEFSRGADAVGGRIVTDRQSRHALSPRARSFFLMEVAYRSLVAELEHYLDPDPFDPLPRHYQHYGASLAVTAEAYARAGGIPLVRTPEDEAFYQSLLRVDAKFRHSPLVKVTTSARESGRSPVGLASQLKVWTEMKTDACFEVESVKALASRFQSRRELRSFWQKLSWGYSLSPKEIEPLANSLGIPTDRLSTEIKQTETFGQLFEKVDRHQQTSCIHYRYRVDIKTALTDIRQYIAAIRRGIPTQT